jgi:hypothetical protein
LLYSVHVFSFSCVVSGFLCRRFNTTLTALDLEFNHIWGQGMTAIAAALELNGTLQHFLLGMHFVLCPSKGLHVSDCFPPRTAGSARSLACTLYCVLCTVLCTVDCVLCIVYCVLCTVHCSLCMCTVYCVLCTVHCVLCNCMLCTVCFQKGCVHQAVPPSPRHSRIGTSTSFWSLCF